ncbi:MAG: hypothetical protein Tsb0021_05260 [Chlamydiales bacterium]
MSFLKSLHFIKPSKLLIVIYFMFFTCSLSAQDKSELKECEEIPNPIELSPQWWCFFEDTKKLRDHIYIFKLELEQLSQSLNRENHQPLYELINRIGLSLDIYLQKKNTPFERPVSSLQYLHEYTVNQMLQINKNLHLTKLKIQNINEWLIAQQNTINQLEKKKDNLFIYYHQLHGPSYEKLSNGLEIIEKRILIAIENEQKRLLNDAKNFYSDEENKLKQELDLALENLIFPMTQDSLQNDIAEVKRNIAKTETERLKIQKENLYIEKSAIANPIACCINDLNLMIYSIGLENAQLELLIYKIYAALQELSDAKETKSINDLNGYRSEWKKTLSDKEHQASIWEKILEDEQAKLGTEIAEISLIDEQNSEQAKADIPLIHQKIDKAYAGLKELSIRASNASILIDQFDRYLIKEKSIFETWSLRLQKYINTIYETFNHFINIHLFKVDGNPVTVANILKSLMIILVSYYISHLIRKSILRNHKFIKNLKPSTGYIISRLIHFFVIFLGFILALSSVGLSLTNFFIVAGALGVGIGFGLQSTVNNIFSGFMLLFQRNINVGDIVELEKKVIGKVVSINLTNTHILSFDGIDLIVPNGQLTQQMITNWTMKNTFRRFHVPFGVAYGTDKEKVKKVVIDAVKKLQCTVTNDSRYADPQIWFTGFGDNAILFELVVWVDLTAPAPHGTAVSSYYWEIDSALKENNIEIPFPQRDIYIKEMPENA